MNSAQYHQSSEKYVEQWPEWLKLKRLTILNFGRVWELINCYWECKADWQFLRKLIIYLPYD